MVWKPVERHVRSWDGPRENEQILFLLRRLRRNRSLSDWSPSIELSSALAAMRFGAQTAQITIPATLLAQAMRNPARQARLWRLIRKANTDLVAFNGRDASAVGLLLARTATADIVDAHVVICAQRAGQAIVTSDASDLKRIAPELPLVVV